MRFGDISANKLKNLGRAGLFSATLIWGLSFVLMKNALDDIPTLYILSIRFLGAALVLLPFCARGLKKLDKTYLGGAAIMGVALVAAYVSQTYGLMFTTPGKNAFLTSVYCVIVPFLNWFIIKKRPDRFNTAAAFMCVIGVGFISLERDLTVGLGDALTLVCGFCFAVHIIFTSRFVDKRDPVMLAMLQFAFAGIIALTGALSLETAPPSLGTGAVWNMVFLTVVSTAVCILLQIFGQKYTPPSQTAVIMTLEAVFGALSSVVLLGEAMTPRLVAGFVFTFAAVIISETKLGFLGRRSPSEGTF